MTWTKDDCARYEAHELAGKARTAARRLANTGHRCHLCDGGGEVFEMDGWAIPEWAPCYLCNGTGKRAAPHPAREETRFQTALAQLRAGKAASITNWTEPELQTLRDTLQQEPPVCATCGPMLLDPKSSGQLWYCACSYTFRSTAPHSAPEEDA